ncbi:hypothetical protein ACVIGB_000025 [Bradyrhizobium sp. USDA 4341]
MSEERKRIEVEISLAVADYLDSSGPDAAFRRASTDEDGALNAAREHLFHELDATTARRVTPVSASYMETDAANPSHACAVYRVLLDAPAEIAKDVRNAFSQENDTSPSP